MFFHVMFLELNLGEIRITLNSVHRDKYCTSYC